MLRASLGKVVHTVKRAGTYAAKVSHKELHKIAVHVRAVVNPIREPIGLPDMGLKPQSINLESKDSLSVM
jgi:hypothetical protein